MLDLSGARFKQSKVYRLLKKEHNERNGNINGNITEPMFATSIFGNIYFFFHNSYQSYLRTS